MKQHEAVLVEHNMITPAAIALPEEVEADLIPLTPEQEDDVEALFELFTQQKRESIENVPLSIQKCDTCLTLKNTVFEDSKPEMVSKQSDDVNDDVILVQLDEVVTKSQEKNRKTNLTYTGTVEDCSGRVESLVAESSEALIW